MNTHTLTRLTTLAALAAIVSFSSVARAGTVQTATNPGQLDAHNGGVIYNGSNPFLTVTLASGTNVLNDISGSMNIADQGWGNQVGNDTYYGLFVNNADVINGFAAHAGHTQDTFTPQYTFQTFDLAGNATLLAQFNTALAGIDWSSNPNVTVELFWDGTSYPGYETHINSAVMSVDSDIVAAPDGGMTIGLLGIAMAGLVSLRRKFARA